MIFALYPEEGNEIVIREHLFLPFCQNDGGQGLVDSVERTGEQTGLLASNHKHASRGADLVDRRDMLVSSAELPVLTDEDLGKCAPAVVSGYNRVDVPVIIRFFTVIVVEKPVRQFLMCFPFPGVIIEKL